jgi:hypothetical protein
MVDTSCSEGFAIKLPLPGCPALCGARQFEETTLHLLRTNFLTNGVAGGSLL